MAYEKLEPILLARPCHYILPDDLMFRGLFRDQNRGIARIRFSRGRSTKLDIPLSAESLCALVQSLSALHGIVAEELNDELADLEKKGLGVAKD